MVHILIKFIGKREWAEAFLDGHLYMNTLYYFWNEYPLEEAVRKKEEYLLIHPDANPDDITIPIENSLSHAQADMLEGTIGTASNDLVAQDMGEHALTDTIYRAVGYQYCNVCCFYRLDFDIRPLASGQQVFHYMTPVMDDFGQYVVIIKDEISFLKRIGKAVGKNSYDYLCGDVHYRKLKRNGEIVDLSKRYHIALRTEEYETIPSTDVHIRDCFVKADYYRSQNEWRIALYRGEKTTSPYTLEIGSLRDIACVVKADQMIKTIDGMISTGELKPGREGYTGNISRKEMQRRFVELGNNQMQMITFIG